MIKNPVNLDTTSFQSIDNCRAVRLGETSFAECMMEGPNSCSYALPFGYCFLCQHPRLSDILETTEKLKPDKIVRQ